MIAKVSSFWSSIRYVAIRVRYATVRRRYRNGMITGFRRGEWWIGARHNLPVDALELNAFGLTLIVPYELLADAKERCRGWPSRTVLRWVTLTAEFALLSSVVTASGVI